SDDADTITTQHAHRKAVDDGAPIVAFADIERLDDQRAGRRRIAGADGSIADGSSMRTPLLTQRLQRFETPHIAFAPGGDAVAQPVFFGDDLAIELVLIALLFRQNRIAPCLKIGEAALDAPR